MAGDFDDGADHPQPAGVQVDGVGAQAGGLTPAQARSAGHRDDAPIAMRNGGQQLVSERHTGDDLVVVVLFAPLRDPAVLARVVGNQPVAYRVAQHRGRASTTTRPPWLAPNRVPRALIQVGMARWSILASGQVSHLPLGAEGLGPEGWPPKMPSRCDRVAC